MTDPILYLTLAALAVAGLAIIAHREWVIWDRKRELRKMERIGEQISGTRMAPEPNTCRPREWIALADAVDSDKPVPPIRRKEALRR